MAIQLTSEDTKLINQALRQWPHQSPILRGLSSRVQPGLCRLNPVDIGYLRMVLCRFEGQNKACLALVNRLDAAITPVRCYLFDIDGTLTPAWQTDFLPGVVEKLATLPAGVKIALVTNQGAPACRDAGWTRKNGEYATLAEVETRLAQVQAEVGAAIGTLPALYVALAYQTQNGGYIFPAGLGSRDPRLRPDWRKPEPGMLRLAMIDAGVQPGDTLMVGDSDSDRQAAEAAGVWFRWAAEFFAD